MTMRAKCFGYVVLAWLAGSATSGAITAAELKSALDAGEKLTVIDLRSNELYRAGHIPGAINIYHGVIEQRSLPRIGRVVAYCDGLGSTYAPACIAALNAKPGIEAEMLEGGFASWETLSAEMTTAGNLRPYRGPDVIDYKTLVGTGGRGVVVVDVCKGTSGRTTGWEGGLPAFCRAKLSGANLTRNPARFVEKHGGSVPLLVVVDDDENNVDAMREAKRLRAGGYRRVVVLAGGVEAIRREGRGGLRRVSSSILVNKGDGNQSDNTNKSGSYEQ